MSIRERLSGNEAIAYCLKQINPNVMGAFPITPSTEIPQYFSAYVANGQVDTEFVAVESEHSAMSCCIGAQAAGARAVTATSSCGLALMWEMLYIAASCRLPVTLACVNRALSGPININNDHSDSMGARDAGWIQIYAENNQEAYDHMCMAMRIGEHPDVMLPVMVCQDGFITSHAIENIELLEDEKVKAFVGEYKPAEYLLHPDHPVAMGPYDIQPYYMEHKYQQVVAMENAKEVIADVFKEFEGISGRKFDFIEEYMMEDAERAIVIIGSSAGTAREEVRRLREQGEKVGMIKLRVFRPFPTEKIIEALKNVKVVAVMDKTDSFNANGGPLYEEICTSLYGAENAPKIVNFIYGLGGRDVSVESIGEVFAQLDEILKTGNTGKRYRHLGVRGL